MLGEVPRLPLERRDQTKIENRRTQTHCQIPHRSKRLLRDRFRFAQVIVELPLVLPQLLEGTEFHSQPRNICPTSSCSSREIAFRSSSCACIRLRGEVPQLFFRLFGFRTLPLRPPLER